MANYRRPAKDVEAFFVKPVDNGSTGTTGYWLIENPDGTQERLTPEEFKKEGYAEVKREHRAKAPEPEKKEPKPKVNVKTPQGNDLIGKAHED